MSVMVFSLPLMCCGVSRQQCSFLRRRESAFLAFPLVCQVHKLQYHSFVAKSIQKLLDHFGVIINNPFVTPAVIFLLNNWNFHSDICNGSCSFLHAPHSTVGDVFEQQPINNHSDHVHIPSPCLDSSFICIVPPLGINGYCGIVGEFYVHLR
jgi:hypothetical protein